MIMYLKRLPRWARMEAEHSKGHHFPIVASPINISTPVPSSLYVTQRYPYMIAQNQVSSYNPFHYLFPTYFIKKYYFFTTFK